MRKILSLAALGVAVLLAGGCGSSAGAGQNWIFYSYEESVSDGKSTTKYTVQECVNIKHISQASYYPAKADSKDGQAFLWMTCAGKKVEIRGSDADKIWKQMHSNN